MGSSGHLISTNLLVAAVLTAASLLGGAEAYMPMRMAASVSCLGASCRACAHLEVKDHKSVQVHLKPCFLVDFEGRDMAVHFVGFDDDDDDEVVFEKEISGESPHPVCYIPNNHEFLQVCLRFYHVNSIGNSLQVCTKVFAGIINNAASVFASTGCFVADTQSSSIKFSVYPRNHKDDKR